MLTTPLNKAIRTTAPHLRRLKEMGIETVRDFLMYFPRTYTDQREVCRILDIQIGAVNTIQGVIKSFNTKSTWRRRMKITSALISDESGTVTAVFFNQPYLERILKQGDRVFLNGKAKIDPAKRGNILFQNPNIEIIKPQQIHTARIVPVYHETELGVSGRQTGKRLSSKWIREKLFSLLPFAETFQEFLPEEILKDLKLMPFGEAVKNAHFPVSEKDLDLSKKRLAFNELFLLQLAALHRKYLWRKIAADEKKQIKADWELIKKFTQSLPFKLTDAQKKAIFEILKDMERPFPMSRLLEGDTGSGKTAVAAAAILNTIKAGFQCCMLAPTEILARQHIKTLTDTLKPFGIEPILLIGAISQKEKNEISEKLKKGEIKLIVGTHAILQENISFSRLGLAIVDEQHRFGVKQREKLKTYGSPHLLSLTATPIPRSLALILYGDQDLSILDEMPAGRQKIITRIVPEEKRKDAYAWICEEIKKGRQAFIIFPLIEESEELQIKAAVQEFERLKKDVFSRFDIRLLHGQMQSKDKAQIMNDFAAGKTQLLVSTAVVEVGVDVPNATIMVIEAAERFGLAQLHQFRGRVGRGEHQSYCLLFPSLETPQILKRLFALVKHDSGFKLAEIDMQLRGPGEVYGTAQSGIPDLKMAQLTDSFTIKQAREAAQSIMEKDPELKSYPALIEKIGEQQNIAIDY